ncbi:MAG: response regulator [Thermodesulfobacteriota bacterium]
MPAPVKTAKILIADDSSILNNVLRDLFEESGFEVVQAFDGSECKTAFLKERPDLVFLDVQMPEIDGLDVLRYIKKKSPQTPVVIMTGAGDESTAVGAMKLGADDYLKKPFGSLDVVGLAKNLVSRQEARRENIRLRRKIRQSERYLAHLTTIINEALVTTDPQGLIDFVNLAAVNLWGYSQEELKHKDVHFLVRGEARTLLHRDLVKETLEKGRLEGEFHFRRRDKGTFPGYLSTSVIRDKNRIRGIVMVVADLTRLYEAEMRLKKSEKLASMGMMVEGIAHEMRNSLTSLGGFTRRVRRLASSMPQLDDYTRIMLGDVGRLEDMVQQIEEYVRFAKFYTFDFVKVDLRALVDQARARAVEKLDPAVSGPVRFKILADDVPQVMGDPVALEEVFYNIVLNAYEAMPRGGSLIATIKRLNSAVSVSISDTGVGVHAEEISEIFNPFFTSKTKGAGMGLTKVHLLVEEHGGTVNVRSELGKGTTFEVILPIERLLTGHFSWQSVSRGHPAH